MKKLFLILVFFSCYQIKANAQDEVAQDANNQQKPSPNYRAEERKRQVSESNFAKFNPSNLSDENKELLKKEQELHRQNFKNITGVDVMLGEEEKNLSPDQHKTRSENIRNTMKNLPENKKAEFKQEMQRHRNQMKNITGVDLVMPNDNQNNQFNNTPRRNCQGPSPEQMAQHRQAMENLSAEKKELIKKEMERHRLEMKNITGIELPKPKCEDELR
ncbi:MAG: hypothetical protein ACKO6C_05955 [Alphaproteobacteria bacterium]